ncbi:MAG: MarR family transcriptional regulator, partial [Solirubrobacterales bacterium]|nr:MarR family transcriptional regulator [Solirubrobacterales bacterium]
TPKAPAPPPANAAAPSHAETPRARPAPAPRARPRDGEFAFRLQRAIARLSRQLGQVAAGSDLTPSQLSVLGTAVRAGPLRLSELAEIEGINPTMLSRIVAHLRADGLLERVSDPSDRRAALVSASPEGARRQATIRRERARALELRMGALTPEERAALELALPALELLAERRGARGGRSA